MHNQPAVSACAQHIVQTHDHPNMEFSEAKEQVLRYNEATESERGDVGDDPDGDGVSIAPTGGTTNDYDDDPARSMPDVPNNYKPTCPQCGEDMKPTTKGVTYTGHYDGEEIQFTTDGNDYRCPDCSIVLTENNETVTSIEA